MADLKEWVKAADLKPGQWLRTSAGTLVQVEAVRPFTQQRRLHNLTVDGIHTCHVLAGATPVLVHNCNLKRLQLITESKRMAGSALRQTRASL
ncbi:hypothetical protein [Micromonospora sp. NPDC005172]|uniref:hypothetical protein n=1 Tax=Micromonospora sp. NPDC005172 TaxID=3156867 RepID=UPI0033AF1C12